MATYYVKRISGTIRYAEDVWPTELSASSVSLQAVINTLDAAGNELVLYPDVFPEAIVHTGNDVTLRTASLFELDGVDDPTVTIGPPPTSNYTLKAGNGISGLRWKGLFKFIGYAGFNFGTVSFQSGCSDISICKLGGYRPMVESSNDADDFPVYIFGDANGHPSGIVLDGVDCETTHYLAPSIRINTCKNGVGNKITDCRLINTGNNGDVLKGTCLQFMSSDGWVVENCEIGDDGRIGYGVSLLDSDGNEIRNNLIRNAWNGLLYPSGNGFGVSFSGSSENNIVYANTVYRCNRGITFVENSGAGGNVASFNTVIESQVNGIDHQSSVDYYDYIINNTVIHKPLGNAGHGIDNQLGGKKVVIKNNIVYAHTDHARPHNIQCIAVDDTAVPNNYTIDADYNLYFVAGTAYIAAVDGANYDTLLDYQAAVSTNVGFVGKEQSSMSQDPNIDEDTGRISNSSPCINAGAWITGVNDTGEPDPWGNYVHRLPNIGADQGAGSPGSIQIVFEVEP